MINAETENSWKILRYITRGSVDMQDVSVESVKLYAGEIVSYWKKYCYLLDVVAEILLWRGTILISVFGKECSVWFPLRSALLFAAIVTGLERPDLLPSLLLLQLMPPDLLQLSV